METFADVRTLFTDFDSKKISFIKRFMDFGEVYVNIQRFSFTVFGFRLQQDLVYRNVYGFLKRLCKRSKFFVERS